MLNRIRNAFRRPAHEPARPSPGTSVPDFSVRTAPSVKTALDIFAGEWNSKLPGEPGLYVQGLFDTFNAPSVAWGVPTLGGVEGKQVLDLGPLEGGNSYMLSNMGAASVTAVEANSRAFLRCLVIKEIYSLDRVHFLCGDCSEYLRTCGRQFDLCVANGILYHMQNPVELLTLLARASSHLLICTHYYAEDVIKVGPIAHKFSSHSPYVFEGFRHTLHRYEYQTARETIGFSGGTAPHSHWLSRQDILDCLKHLGFREITVNFEDPTYKFGPAFTVAARK